MFDTVEDIRARLPTLTKAQLIGIAKLLLEEIEIKAKDIHDLNRLHKEIKDATGTTAVRVSAEARTNGIQVVVLDPTGDEEREMDVLFDHFVEVTDLIQAGEEAAALKKENTMLKYRNAALKNIVRLQAKRRRELKRQLKEVTDA